MSAVKLGSQGSSTRSYFAPVGIAVSGHTATFSVTDGGLGDDDWVTVIAERRSRQGTAPDGGAVTLEDGIVLLRRA